MKITKILATAAVASIVGGAIAATASAYNAYLCYQTAPYSFRNAWDDGTYGLASGYYDSVIVWSDDSLDDPSQKIPEYADNFDWDLNAYLFDGGFTDAVVEADGTYTVSSDGFVWGVDGADAFNLIFVSTDIPTTASVTSATLYVDGVAQLTIENPEIDTTKDYIQLDFCNIWNPDLAAYTGAFPTESISVEFTVTGLGGSADAGDDAATGGDISGDTGAATDDGKGSADTGVEGVAAVAGLAVVAGGALLLSKKRK